MKTKYIVSILRGFPSGNVTGEGGGVTYSTTYNKHCGRNCCTFPRKPRLVCSIARKACYKGETLAVAMILFKHVFLIIWGYIVIVYEGVSDNEFAIGISKKEDIQR